MKIFLIDRALNGISKRFTKHDGNPCHQIWGSLTYILGTFSTPREAVRTVEKFSNMHNANQGKSKELCVYLTGYLFIYLRDKEQCRSLTE